MGFTDVQTYSELNISQVLKYFPSAPLFPSGFSSQTVGRVSIRRRSAPAPTFYRFRDLTSTPRARHLDPGVHFNL